jgi:hypothetical protein
MKLILILFLLVHLLSSCVTYKNLTKHETITHELLAGLKPDRKYIFELKNGVRQIVKVTEVKDDIITGLMLDKNGVGKKWIDYSATFDSMQTGVAKISVSKVNPYVTGAGILGVALVTTVIIWANTAW